MFEYDKTLRHSVRCQTLLHHHSDCIHMPSISLRVLKVACDWASQYKDANQLATTFSASGDASTLADFNAELDKLHQDLHLALTVGMAVDVTVMAGHIAGLVDNATAHQVMYVC